MEFGGLLGEPVYASMYVGIDIEILVAHGVEHAQRLLGGCAVVELNQGFVVDGAREDGEIGAHLMDIIHRLNDKVYIPHTC